MDRRTLGSFGIGATVGAAVCALLTTGVLDRAPATVARTIEHVTRPASAAADELPAFDGCAALRDWYVEAALPLIGPWGFGTPFLAAARDGVAVAGAPLSPQSFNGRAVTSKGVGSSDTGTNVQEAGVDEPDVAKTDGEILVRIRGADLVVTDVSGDEPRTLSRIGLVGARQSARELLLVGDTVLVLGTEAPYWYGGWRTNGPGLLPKGAGSERTHLYQVNVSEPAAPVVERHQRVDGSLVAAREYGDGTVRVVLSTGLPPLDFVHPNRDRTPRQARLENRRIVRETTVEDWLPATRVDGGAEQPLITCTDVRHPDELSGPGTISVLTFAIDEPDDATTLGVTTAGSLVYSSTDRLYVATLPGFGGPVPLAAGDRGPVRPPRTEVHAFALDETTTEYVASGTVRGTVEDRWSLDEQDGRLRVASALGRSWNPRENAVTVLVEDDGDLREVGSVAGLGKGERIQSVRWLGDLAIVVTFRQVDPLYTVDLSDPTSPAVLGALKIRGFSDYLHPVGGDRLLGVGQDATGRGSTLGAQAAVFDLADLRAVERTDTVAFGPDTNIPSGTDPRTFTYLPDRGVALVPVESWRRGGSRLVALSVDADGSLRTVDSWTLSRRWGAYSARALPLADGRLALVDGRVRIITVP